jgi:hypothetical protein
MLHDDRATVFLVKVKTLLDLKKYGVEAPVEKYFIVFVTRAALRIETKTLPCGYSLA